MNSSDIIYAIKSSLYALPPEETYHETLKDTPNIYPTILILVLSSSLVEGLIYHLLGLGKNWSLHIVMLNILTGIFFLAWNVFLLRGVDLYIYIWCYNNIRIAHLPWNEFYTYVIAMTGVDFCTYWWHRMGHEVAIFWAAHSSHHSGEEFNLSFSTRISIFIRFTKWLYFVPLGMLGVPPSIFMMHAQLNFAFGLWSHSLFFPKTTKIIPGLGHLIEFFMVTPSHHRVHHGANKYCLDKNYGMYLIIWDRMFGTFVEEREDEPIVYGTVSQLDTFHVVNVQTKPHQQLYQKMQTMKTTGDKLRTLFFGPGWSPGTPRLGDELPDIKKREKVELSLPLWLNMYVAFHVVLMAFITRDTVYRVEMFGQWLSLVNFSIIFSACMSLGALYDSNHYAVWLEPLRLIFLAVASHLYPLYSSHLFTTYVSTFCLGSLLFWPMLRDHLHSSNANTTSAQNGVKKHKRN